MTLKIFLTPPKIRKMIGKFWGKIIYVHTTELDLSTIPTRKKLSIFDFLAMTKFLTPFLLNSFDFQKKPRKIM